MRGWFELGFRAHSGEVSTGGIMVMFKHSYLAGMASVDDIHLTMKYADMPALMINLNDKS